MAFLDLFAYLCMTVYAVGFGDIIIRPPELRVISIIFVLWGTVTLGFMIHVRESKRVDE